MNTTRTGRGTAARPGRLLRWGTAGAVLIAAAGTAAPAAAREAPATTFIYHGPLYSVSADSPSDAWTVGIGADYQKVVHWNGTGLAKVSRPAAVTNSQLFSVSATSADDAWAVGYQRPASIDQTFIVHWDGSHWAKVHSPNPPAANVPGTLLQDVSADSASDAWAVGYYSSKTPDNAYRTLILHWNGTSWARIPSPNPGVKNSFLSSVSADSATDAWAVGDYQTSSFAIKTLILHWDGTSWTQVTSPNPGGASDGGDLNGISASSATDAWATGNYTDSSGVSVSLALHWDGTSWTQVSTPSPGGLDDTLLTGVTDLSPTNAWAVGQYRTGPHGKLPNTLALHWDGTSWTQVTTPNPGGPGGSRLIDVSGTSATDVWAVGTYNTASRPGNGRDHGLILHWDGTGWTQF
ncbi:MAG TPA: hypothetical protein VGI31_07805 [Streptosporangiaceae bacterium]